MGYVSNAEPASGYLGVQRLNHWAIKVPERPSRLRLAGSLHYSPFLYLALRAKYIAMVDIV